MELDTQQFERLLTVLGTEPATNLLGAANITAMMSVFIAAILGFLTFIEYDKRKRAKDADFIFGSERDYGGLFDDLVAVGDWAKREEVKSQLDLIDITTAESAHGREILEQVVVPEEIWRHARSIKTHFKAIAKFHSQKIVSKNAVYASLDHWGYRLLMDSIRKMDVHRFYYARRDELTRINKREFDADFFWYCVLERIKPI